MCFLEARSGSYPAFSNRARTFSLPYLSAHCSRISVGSFDSPFEFGAMRRLSRLSMALWEISGGGTGASSRESSGSWDSLGSWRSGSAGVETFANASSRSLIVEALGTYQKTAMGFNYTPNFPTRSPKIKSHLHVQLLGLIWMKALRDKMLHHCYKQNPSLIHI